MPVGVGAETNVAGAYIVLAAKGWSKRVLNCLYINEIRYFNWRKEK